MANMDNSYLGKMNPFWLINIFQMGGKKPPTSFDISIYFELLLLYDNNHEILAQLHKGVSRGKPWNGGNMSHRELTYG